MTSDEEDGYIVINRQHFQEGKEALNVYKNDKLHRRHENT